MLFRRSNPADADLVRAILQGHASSFSLLVERYKNLVYTTLLSRVAYPDEAEELAQETFLKAFRRLAYLEDPRRFGPWVRQIAENLAFSALRSRYRATVDSPEWQSFPAAPPAPQAGVWKEAYLGRALGELSLEDREILLLWYVEESSPEQIAGFLNLSVTAVKGRLRRAHETLGEGGTAELRGGVQAQKRGRDFTRKVMDTLPLVPWHIPGGQRLLFWGHPRPKMSLGLALVVHLGWTLMVVVLALGLAQGWWAGWTPFSKGQEIQHQEERIQLHLLPPEKPSSQEEGKANWQGAREVPHSYFSEAQAQTRAERKPA